jgi:ferredoxin-NADP reductase
MGLPPELEYVFGDTPTVFKRVRLISRAMVAENTLALTIEQPQDFNFDAGQNITISLPGEHASDLREFTIASAPYEKDLMIAMRVRNTDFKNACYALKLGSVIDVRYPAGALWKETVEPQIWLSGGIGVTPFRSIIRHLFHQGTAISVTHLHSDHSHTTAPFLEEFESYDAQKRGFHFFLTTTREAREGGLHGRITGEMITLHAPIYATSHYFVVGSDSFIGGMRTVLAALGISTDRIRTERFDGYQS